MGKEESREAGDRSAAVSCFQRWMKRGDGDEMDCELGGTVERLESRRVGECVWVVVGHGSAGCLHGGKAWRLDSLGAGCFLNCSFQEEHL